MKPNIEADLMEIMDLARTLRQEQLYIQQEQNAFVQLTETLTENSAAITKLAYICAQQRQNLNDLIMARPEAGPSVCCRRANNYENAKYVDAKKQLGYEHAIAYEELFNHLYRSPYLLALSLAAGDRLAEITPQHLNCVIHTICTGLYGNAIHTKDVEMILKLLRELIEIQIVVNENPRQLLRANSSAFARLYHRLNESMFSAKIFLTAALFDPIMGVLSDDTLLDVDPSKVVLSFTSKERLRRFGSEDSNNYRENVLKFHDETINKLYALAKSVIDSLTYNWSLFPSTLRWLVQTMCHHLKQAHFSDKIINEIITDMVFTHFICPAIVSPDIIGIIDAPISEQVRFNLIQIGQIIQMLALAKHDDVDAKFAEVHAKFEANTVSKLIDLLVASQYCEDVVAILSQQSDFERSHLLSTQNELAYFVEFYRILVAHDSFDVPLEEHQNLKKILARLPENTEINGNEATAGNNEIKEGKERSKQSFMNLGKTKKSKSFKGTNGNGGGGDASNTGNDNCATNGGTQALGQVGADGQLNGIGGSASTSVSSNHSSPTRSYPHDILKNESILVFNIYTGDYQKLQPLTEEEVMKEYGTGTVLFNEEPLDDTETCNIVKEMLSNQIEKSSVTDGFDAIDSMNDVLRPLHAKTTRFSLSHDDASIGNSDNLEAVSEAPSNHSVTSSLELEENDQNDNLSDMVSANVSGRGTPNISGRDTPSSQVTDGESVTNALATPQMQKLISKVRSDIEDKFCKFELKKFEGDETVSIISDTWSTDVLASDSETLDASERERDRNFSTPLIPSAVVLPGDNNFDALSGAGGIRPGYLDVSDQRSESNWSTDVLASDSEKFAEVDTDDNVSITAKSDITDSGARSEQERDMLAAAISAPTAESTRRIASSPFYISRNNSGFRANATPSYGSVRRNEVSASGNGSGEGSQGSGSSDRSQEDSAFFDAVNLLDEASVTAASNGGAVEENSGTGEEQSLATAIHYQCLSSLARSSVRTTNQYTGENNFQQNYKSSNSEYKEQFLGTPRMRRQMSAESSISNHSVSMEEAITAGKPPKSHHKSGMKKKKHGSNNNENAMPDMVTDLIDFSDFGEEKAKVHSGVKNSKTGKLVSEPSGDEHVERRTISSEQRTVGFDGRRNGIMAMKGNSDSVGSNSTPSLRRHQSLNYENHEIMIDNLLPKRTSMAPGIHNAPQTDDDKSQQQQQILLLCAKTERLKLNDIENTGDLLNGVAAEPIPSTSRGSNTGIITNANGSSTPAAKPTKSTGAIPKSISFDASADKNNSSQSAERRGMGAHRSGRIHDGVLRHATFAGNNSGIFNKLKQGWFKHRRGNKSHRHSTAPADDFSHSSSRSVSFSASAAEASVDLMGSITGAGGRGAAVGGYADITEDILAKYRRKVSTSSEATNSDSVGNSALTNGKNLDEESKVTNVTLHDKTVAFNVVMKKIRTVLSKTVLHTGDFRHTTYTNASPLLTYLQIQLAQAINLQNFHQISYVSEAIRCVSALEMDSQQHRQLLKELKSSICRRENYLQYLMRYRQNLLLIMENIEQFEARLRNESTICNRYLMAVCVRLFLEKRQTKIEEFQEEFTRLTMSDDKIELVEEFIEGLMEELLSSGGILHGMADWQAQEARSAIERILLQRIYQQVMFPNEDADLSRDTVLSEHIRKLQRVISPAHPALCIPQEYLSEAPWTFAQQQLSYISAYKTPREKLQCVIRCISSIMSLLHMSSGRVPAADDILPVLIYVVIMTNPPYLLSTVEYITCFIGEKLDGEEQFHWTLFGSVVKFIKTMDYLD